MEPEQKYLMVGVFVVAVVAGLLVFAVWLSGLSARGGYDLYQTYFMESVNGLNMGAPVKYRGVDVGKVSKIEIAKDNPANIHIEMQIVRGTPITIGTTATLQMQGITGTSYIELKGALADQPLLKSQYSETIPVIPSTPSQLQQIVNSVPEILQKVSDLTDHLNAFASEENSQRFTNIMTNLETFSKDVGSDGGGASLMAELRTTSEEIGKAAHALTEIANNSKADTQRILKSTSVTIDKINTLVDSTGQLSQQGYKDLNALLIEMKKTARDIQNLSRNLKENPSQIVIPQQQGGVKAK